MTEVYLSYWLSVLKAERLGLFFNNSEEVKAIGSGEIWG